MKRCGSQPALSGSSNAGCRQLFRPLAVQLGNMTTFTATGQAAGLIEKAELHRFVAIALLGANLEHVTRARLNDGDGDAIPRLVINLRHPDLAAEYSLGHRYVPVVGCLAGPRVISSRITRASFQSIGNLT